VVKTITHLPQDYAHGVQITINDREFQVVARNVILLLYGFTSIDDEQPTLHIAEALIHTWYSAFLPASLLSSLRSRVGSLINAVCTGISNKAPESVHKKTWKFRSGSTLRLSLQKQDWLRLERYLQVPKHLDFNEARKIRSVIVLAPERVDYRERWYYKDASPSMRLAKQRFREDGLLLPFGHPRVEFDTPNPYVLLVSNLLI